MEKNIIKMNVLIQETTIFNSIYKQQINLWAISETVLITRSTIVHAICLINI